MKKYVLAIASVGILMASAAVAQNSEQVGDKSAAECYLECGPLHPWSPGDRMKCIDDCVG